MSPDVYVVVGAPAHLRDTYLLWNEPKGPDFVLEVTSASTRRADERRKRDVYAALGVSEYFLYDPRAEYLTPPLQGYRLRAGAYRPLPSVTVLSNRGVAVASEVLGLELRDEREARMVRLHDPATGQDLLTYEESERAPGRVGGSSPGSGGRNVAGRGAHPEARTLGAQRPGAPPANGRGRGNGAGCQTRTGDLMLTRQLLYQLS